MLINWFTVIAQIINFLVLIWLLKRFLYIPILKAIDDREIQVAAKIEDAEAKKALAEKERAEFQKKNTDFEALKVAAWDRVVEETKAERQRLTDDARNSTDELRTKLETSLQDEQNSMGVEFARKTQSAVFTVARKTLLELADDSLEQRIITIFIKRLTDLNEEEKKKLTDAFRSSKTPVEIRSTFDLIQPQQEEIERILKGLLGEPIEFKFNTIPELISGIELLANGYKLAWSISAYLGSVGKLVMATDLAKSKINGNV